MATTSHASDSRDRLQVSAYEQASGLLLACLVLLGFVVGVLFLAWCSTRVVVPQAVRAVQMRKDVGGGGDGSEPVVRAIAEEFEEPTANEVSHPDPKPENLDAISLAAAQPEVLADFNSGERSSSFGKGKGKGRGDYVGDGEGPGTEAGVPAWERWEVRLNATTTAEYARQLDFFQIELGIAGGSPDVTYLTNLSAARPTVRTGKPQDEQRLRFLHRNGALRDADQRLAGKAGVDTSEKVVFHFYPDKTYQQLLSLETNALGSHSISAVRRTVFGVTEIASGYEFYVLSQEFR